jgi:FtsZ-binding cell division protein ZapB
LQIRGIKKLVTEMTRVRFLLLVFVCIGIWQKFIQDSIGLGTALLIIGIREVPVDAIIGKLTGGLASGSLYTRKLWNMVQDQIVQEDKAIQEELEKEVTRLDQREKELVQENARIKQQLASAQEEKRMLLGRLHEIETQLNAPLTSHYK